MEQHKEQQKPEDKRENKSVKSDAEPITRENKRHSLGPDILWEELP